MSQEIVLPKFTILWVEDTDDVVTMQEEKIRTFLKNKGFDLDLIWEKKGNNVESKIQTQSVDLILVDNNIPGPSGSALIKNIRKHLPLTDIFFYSANKILDKTYKEIGRLGMVQFWEGKRVVSPAKKLIEKSLERYNDMYFIRGYIIARSIELELKMNEFLSSYFKIPTDSLLDFHKYLLENKYNMVIAKKVIIDKILKDYQIKNEFPGLGGILQDIFEMRNKVAHCKVSNENTLVSMGDETTINRTEINKLIKKLNKASEMIEGLKRREFCKTKAIAKKPISKKPKVTAKKPAKIKK